jgi:membrane associated rhomboid family serine protease
MELGFKLFTYIILANLLYMILSLLRQGFKHYSGYIGQLLVFVAMLVHGMVTGYGSGVILLCAVIGTFILVIIPIILQRHMDILIAEGLFTHLRIYARLKAALAWSNVNNHLQVISESAYKHAGNLELLEKEIRKHLGLGEPYDSITRVFLGFIHFNNRNYLGLIKDLRNPELALPNHSFDELMYLVRAYLEVGDYEEAILSQIALESKANAFINNAASDKYGSLVISRMISYAFLGWNTEFTKLMEENHEGINSLPPSLTDFWAGVCTFNSGDFDSGESKMYSVIKSAAELDEDDPWLPFMRNRLRGLMDNKDFFNTKILPHLTSLNERYGPILHDTITKQKETQSQFIKANSQVSNFLIAVTCAFSLYYIVQYNIFDAMDLLRIGSNSSFLVKQGEYFRLLSHQFVHLGFLHLFMNMFAIRIFGPMIETLLGGTLFLFLYFFSGIMGGALAAHKGQQLSAGASGAVFGLLAASLVFELFSVDGINKIDKRTSKSTLLFILGINIAIGLIEHNIDNWAHLGGLIGGAVIALLLLPTFKSKLLKTSLKLVLGVLLIATFGYGYQSASNSKKSAAISHSYLGQPFKELKSDIFSYSADIPASWQSNEEDKEIKYLLAFGPLGERFTSYVIPINNPIDLIIERELEQFKKEIESSDKLEFNWRQGPSLIKVKDMDVRTIYWELSRGEVPYSISEFYFEFENKIIYFNFTVQTSDKNAYTPLFMRILESVKSIDKP